MQFRFLYLDPRGVEHKISTLEELRDGIRDGVILEDTVLYDATTGEWGPARAHGTWREIRDELDGRVGDAPDPRAGTPPATHLTLAPDFLDEDSSVEAFLAARERERREEAQRRGSDVKLPRTVRPEPMLAPLEFVPGQEDAGPEAMAAAPDEVETQGDAPRPASRPRPSEPRAGSPRRVGTTGPTREEARRRRRTRTRAATAALAVCSLVMIWMWVGDAGPADADVPPTAQEEPGGAPPPVNDAGLASVLAEVEGSAFESMVLALDSLRAVFDVVAPPEEWLGGHYLANASDYPQVPAYWSRYLNYVDELREEDEIYFRQGYVARLEAAGLTGPVASMRLARAMGDFDGTAPARDSVYDAMEQVAEAALSLHILLLEREADITWTPVRPGFVTRDPILEAVPDDPELQEALNERLDLLLDNMDVVRGGMPGSGAELGAAALRTLQGTRPAAEVQENRTP